MALDLDNRVLCFDGDILDEQDLSPAKSLVEGGLFVVRSVGGEPRTAMVLADLLQQRRATVVVYDYCLLACASYLLFASAKTIVLKDSLVAWRYSSEPPWCPSLVAPKDGGPKRLDVALCSDAPAEYQSGYAEFRNLNNKFYAARIVDPLAEWPPESVIIRRMLRSGFEGTGRFPDAFWTWNPRYYAASIKTRVIYEAYPKSQREVDAMASKLGLGRVLYDP
jgi:hypothetical protein